jgi:2'-5' RNA ligase
MPEQSELESYRLFVAIHLPDEIKKALTPIQSELKTKLPEQGVAWTQIEQLHITLKFFRNIQIDKIAALSDLLGAVCIEFSPLLLRADGIGAFPDLVFPRVIWARINESTGKLAQLHETIEISSGEFAGEKPERFHAHVTLGRVKRLKARDRKVLSKELSRLKNKHFGEWTANELTLKRSQLSSKGAVHSLLKTFRLK